MVMDQPEYQERAMHDESWSKLEESLNSGTIIKGYITGKVRGA